MARKLSSPLTQEDLLYLRQRYPSPYVDRQVELHGVEEAESVPEEDEEGSEGTDASGSTEQPGEGTREADEEGSDEDLIGETDSGSFDPADHTEAEVRKHLEEHPDERDRVLELEQNGRGRKGVLAL